MVLNKIIKDRMQPILVPLGSFLGRRSVNPNFLSGLGLGAGLLAGLLFAFEPSQPYLASFAILGSGFMDLLDGSVARMTGKALPGSMNDQTMDRLSEVAIYSGIIYGGYHVSPAIILLTLGISIVSSYIRAKAESLGMRMSNLGIGDRAERLTGLIVFGTFGYVGIAVYLNLIIATVALINRYSYFTHVIRLSANLEAEL